MHVKATKIRRGDKLYQYGQLVESYRRDDGQPTQRLVASLGRCTDLEIANLRLALRASAKGQVVVLADSAQLSADCEVLDNLAWLDVAVVVSVLRQLGIDKILEELLPRDEADIPDADVVLALVAQRCVAPSSKLAATGWFGRTALPELLGLPLARFNNTRLHRVLEGLESCEESLQARLASTISAQHGPFSLLFLDVTDTWFVGRGPSLATPGQTKEGLYRRKIGIALLCDQDGHPLRWMVLEGRRHDSVPMKEMAWALQSVDWARGVPLVLDRAMGATAHIEELLATERPFVTALTRNEFDAYTDRVPSAPLANLNWSVPDAAEHAAAAVSEAGMTRCSDDLYVLDLGVVTRVVQAPPAPGARSEGADKCRERLQAAIAMQAAMDHGEAKSLTEAGRHHRLSQSLASKTLRLLRLAPDLQEAIAGGEAAQLSISSLLDLTRLDDFEAQRKAWETALAEARARPDGRRTRQAGRLSAAPPTSSEPSRPPRLRAVLAFNPQQWVRQKESADRTLGALRAWTRHKNESLRDPRTLASAAQVAQDAHARLKKEQLISAFRVEVDTRQVDGRTVHQLSLEPDPVAWPRRQRFFGFQIIVARPDETRVPAELVLVYRAKDAVEKDFQTIKSVLHLRPVRHRTDAKVRAHVTLCMLALLVERVLDRALRGKVTAAAALDLFADIHLNRLRISSESQPVYTITRGSADHIDLLRALGLASLLDNTEVTASLYAR